MIRYLGAILTGLLLALPCTADEWVTAELLHTFLWQSATGPVDHYEIYVSRDGGNFVRQMPDVLTSSAAVFVSTGEDVSVSVRPVDGQGNVGAFTSASDFGVGYDPITDGGAIVLTCQKIQAIAVLNNAQGGHDLLCYPAPVATATCGAKKANLIVVDGFPSGRCNQ